MDTEKKININELSVEALQSICYTEGKQRDIHKDNIAMIENELQRRATQCENKTSPTSDTSPKMKSKEPEPK